MRSRTTCTVRARSTSALQSENDTQAFRVPPPTETPASWQRAELRYFGLTPPVLAAFLAPVLFGAGLVLLLTGSLAVGMLLLLAAVLLAALYAEQARRRRSSSLDRVAAAAIDHTRALAGFTGASVHAWTHAVREIARLRLDASRWARKRSQLQYALGGRVRGRRRRGRAAACRDEGGRRPDRGVHRRGERGRRAGADTHLAGEARRLAHRGSFARLSGRSWIRTRGLRLIRAAL